VENSLWKKGYGPVVRLTTVRMNEYSFRIYAIWLWCTDCALRARIQKEAWSLVIGAVVAWHELDDWDSIPVKDTKILIFYVVNSNFGLYGLFPCAKKLWRRRSLLSMWCSSHYPVEFYFQSVNILISWWKIWGWFYTFERYQFYFQIILIAWTPRRRHVTKVTDC